MKGSKEIMEKLLEKVNTTLENESPDNRPVDSNGKPGGMIVLRQDLPTLIVPDLHGRHEYLSDLMRYKIKETQVFDLLKKEMVQIVCVGDGMHGERRAAARWKIALEEYKKGFVDCPAMAKEMSENFQTMAMVMRLKSSFPKLFHFLKGNHENIMDEEGNGNHPFAKFAAEGPMTKMYVEKFYGTEFLEQFDRFEKNLPILARGKFFVISHARPKNIYRIDELINYRSNPDLVEGMTWTRHQAAKSENTIKMLDELIGNGVEQRLWFTGHTAISDLYNIHIKEALVEIHNPDLRVLVVIDPYETFDPDEHFLILPKQVTKDT